MNILLVEDDNELRSVIKDIFQSVGISIVEATNGLEALDTIKNFDFDLIITDVQMPKLDGYNLIKAIKSLKIDTPVIVMTGGSRYSKEDFMNIGAFGYFEKGSISPMAILSLFEKSA